MSNGTRYQRPAVSGICAVGSLALVVHCGGGDGVPNPAALDVACRYGPALSPNDTQLGDYLGYDVGGLLTQCNNLASILTSGADKAPQPKDAGPDASPNTNDLTCDVPKAFQAYFADTRLKAPVLAIFDASLTAVLGRAVKGADVSALTGELAAAAQSEFVLIDEPQSSPFADTRLPIPDASSIYNSFGYSYSCKGYIDARVSAKGQAGIPGLSAAIASSATLDKEGDATLVVVDGTFRSPLARILSQDASGTTIDALKSRFLKARIAEKYKDGLPTGARAIETLRGTAIALYAGASVSGSFDVQGKFSAAGTTGFASAEFQAALGIQSKADAASRMKKFALYIPSASSGGSIVTRALPSPADIAAEFARLTLPIESEPNGLRPDSVTYTHHVKVRGFPAETCSGWKVVSPSETLAKLYSTSSSTPFTVVGEVLPEEGELPSGCAFAITGPVALDRTITQTSVAVNYSLAKSFAIHDAPLDLRVAVAGNLTVTNQPRQQLPPVADYILNSSAQPSGRTLVEWHSTLSYVDDIVQVRFVAADGFTIGSADESAICTGADGTTHPLTISPPVLAPPATTTRTIDVKISAAASVVAGKVDPINSDSCTYHFSVNTPLLEGGSVRVPFELTMRVPRVLP